MKASEIKFGKKCGNYVLWCTDPMDFRKWFNRTVKRNGINFTEDFYFDDADCIDATTGETILAEVNSNWCWSEELLYILKHFNYITGEINE